ncbi:MAG TPA: phosphoribosylanthranilate isomerase [Longimicrobium sp.]|nr:phosphoribosylanthranilate isomerase [Longimicrobium sp.]
MTRSPEVKVCGLMRAGDAAVAADAGAAYLGVILAPGFRRTVTPEAARAIFGDLPARRVGVFVDAAPDVVLAAAAAAGLHVVQLHGDEPPEAADALRAAGYEVWKAVRARSGADFGAAAARYGASVDALLVDGYSPAAHGGTGTRFPWHEVAALRDLLPEGVALVAAGGLNPGNVAEAASLLRPHAVDVSSGVESAPGVKDADAVRAFAAAVRALSTNSRHS